VEILGVAFGRENAVTPFCLPPLQRNVLIRSTQLLPVFPGMFSGVVISLSYLRASINRAESRNLASMMEEPPPGSWGRFDVK